MPQAKEPAVNAAALCLRGQCWSCHSHSIHWTQAAALLTGTLASIGRGASAPETQRALRHTVWTFKGQGDWLPPARDDGWLPASAFDLNSMQVACSASSGRLEPKTNALQHLFAAGTETLPMCFLSGEDHEIAVPDCDASEAPSYFSLLVKAPKAAKLTHIMRRP